MTALFLLDTNALSEPVRRRPNQRFLHHFHRHSDAMATAAPAIHEVWFGIRRLPPTGQRSLLERYVAQVLTTLPVLPYDEAAASWHADERTRLVAIGRTPPFIDGQIAAVAATRGLILVTANTADFQHFARLRLANWWNT